MSASREVKMTKMYLSCKSMDNIFWWIEQEQWEQNNEVEQCNQYLKHDLFERKNRVHDVIRLPVFFKPNTREDQ